MRDGEKHSLVDKKHIQIVKNITPAKKNSSQFEKKILKSFQNKSYLPLYYQVFINTRLNLTKYILSE